MNDFKRNPKLTKAFGKNNRVFQNAFCFIYKHYAECFFKRNTNGFGIDNDVDYIPAEMMLFPSAVIDFDLSPYLCGKPNHAFILKYRNDPFVSFGAEDRSIKDTKLDAIESDAGIYFACYGIVFSIFIIHPSPINSETFFKKYPIGQELCEAGNEEGFCVNCNVDWKICNCKKRLQSRLLLNLRFYKEAFYNDCKYPLDYPFFLLYPTSKQNQTLKGMRIRLSFKNKKCLLVERDNFWESNYITRFEKEATKGLDKKGVKVRVNDFKSLGTYNNAVLAQEK